MNNKYEIEGLKELEAAMYDQERYRQEFNQMMEDENNDGACPPKPVQGDFKSLMKKYPRAAAYIKAEGYFYSSHYVKAGAGRKATIQILAGENHDKVIAEMEKEWSDYCSERIWD